MFPWIFLALLIPFHYALYKLFPKAGQPAWAGLIPLYNAYIIQRKICKKPLYWIFFLLLPGINLVMFGCICYNLARAYGKYSTKELFQAVVLFFYFFPKIARDPKTVFVPKEKRPVRKKSGLREWGEALVFAIIAATFIKGYLVEPYKIPTSSMEQDLLVGDFLLVSKLNYGLKLPQTPLTFPFTHNNFYDLPLLQTFAKSYSEAWKIPLIKLPALESIDRNEIVVFNFPANDTTIQTLEFHAHDYYVKVTEEACIAAARERAIGNNYQILDTNKLMKNWDRYMSIGRDSIQVMPIVTHPIDKRNNYIKRCVAISGDKVEVRDGELYIDDQMQPKPKNAQTSYLIWFKANVSTKDLQKYWGMEISPEDMGIDVKGRGLPTGIDISKTDAVLWQLTKDQYEMFQKSAFVDSIKPYRDPKGQWMPNMYPHHPKFPWNRDHFGPLVVPKKGMSINLDENNYLLYKRVIEAYEGHKVDWKNGAAMIDGAVSKQYTFRQNYYFMMGDNRHGSADSRCWGFVPNDHVVGKALIVVASTNDTGTKSFPNNIRWNRFFRLAQ